MPARPMSNQAGASVLGATLWVFVLFGSLWAGIEWFNWMVAAGRIEESYFLDPANGRPARVLLIEHATYSVSRYWRMDLVDAASGTRLLRKATRGRSLKRVLQTDPDRLWMVNSYDRLHARDPETLKVLFNQTDIEAKNPQIRMG